MSLDEQIDRIKLKFEENVKSNNLNIDNLRNEINRINSLTTSEFVSTYSSFDIENDFIKTCFKNGYIENDYLKFVFGQDSSFLPEQENSFVRYVEYGESNSPVKDNYQYNLSSESLPLIINNISTERFLSDKILNIKLFEYILQKENGISKQKTENYFKLLSSNNDNVYNFYKELLQFANKEICVQTIKKLLNLSRLAFALNDIFDKLEETRQDLIMTTLLTTKLDNFNEDIKLSVTNLINRATMLNRIKDEKLIDKLIKIKNIHLSELISDSIDSNTSNSFKDSTVIFSFWARLSALPTINKYENSFSPSPT